MPSIAKDVPGDDDGQEKAPNFQSIEKEMNDIVGHFVDLDQEQRYLPDRGQSHDEDRPLVDLEVLKSRILKVVCTS